jgi:hypothetical protein
MVRRPFEFRYQGPESCDVRRKPEFGRLKYEVVTDVVTLSFNHQVPRFFRSIPSGWLSVSEVSSLYIWSVSASYLVTSVRVREVGLPAEFALTSNIDKIKAVDQCHLASTLPWYQGPAQDPERVAHLP